ncbi:Transcription factor [Penicillium daleae]|uniref:Transcription factor n=1 Tax=Penicillium daleae TaxID=63821 RepID=A0AAD6C6H7_9EURO|nr:Transcription factor [Penicillium daleae]KAJ5453449.1 Transcription factor [Penicillium daleae]
MGKLVEKIIPEASDKSLTPNTERSHRDSPTLSTPTGHDSHLGLDVLEESVGDDSPIGLLLNLRQMDTAVQSTQNMLTPEAYLANQPSTGTSSSRHEKLSRTLYALFPLQASVDAIVNFSTGIYSVASQFYSVHDIIQGQTEMLSAACDIPPVTSHPALLARQLLKLIICIQQLKPGFDFEKVQLRATPTQVMNTIINTVTNNVTSNDDLVGTHEGLECLIMQGLWHKNAGNLRRSWLSYRRAMSVGQLMGIDRARCSTLKSADPSSDPAKRTSTETMWFQINSCDRYLSLLLGLPAGSLDSSFASDEAMQGLTATERLERLQTVASARIVERNRNKSTRDYVLTQAIDFDLETAARSMETGWWTEPSIPTFERGDHTAMLQILHILLQINHYTLRVLLHLPYMLQDSTDDRYHYSKATCTRSSREILRRFISFRTLVNTPFSCRHVDYAALIAAMTLLLSYLKQRGSINLPQPMPWCAQRQEDRKLVEVAKERMQFLAVMNQDKISKECAETIGQMMPILDSSDISLIENMNLTDPGVVHLAIPYLGTVNFHTSIARKIAEPTTFPPRESLAVANMHTVQEGQSPVAIRTPRPTAPALLAEQPIDFASLDPTTYSADGSVIDGMVMEFEPSNDSMLELPDLTAEVEDWVLQGVESTYWSLLQDNDFS